MILLDRLSTGWKAWVALFLITFSAAAPGVFLLPALEALRSPEYNVTPERFCSSLGYVCAGHVVLLGGERPPLRYKRSRRASERARASPRGEV